MNRRLSFVSLIILGIVVIYLCKELSGVFFNGTSATVIIISVFVVMFIRRTIKGVKWIVNGKRYVEELENGEYTLFSDTITRITSRNINSREQYIYITSSENAVSYKTPIYYRAHKGDEVMCIQIEDWIHIYKLVG